MDENYTSSAILEKEMFVSATTDHFCCSRHGLIHREALRTAPAERGGVTPHLAPRGGDGAEPAQRIHAPGFWLPLGPETFGSLSGTTGQSPRRRAGLARHQVGTRGLLRATCPALVSLCRPPSAWIHLP